MAKIADKYLLVDPWAVVEEGFHPERNRVSESIFSLSNEYMGVRGFADEGYGGDTLVGSYFNGLYEEIDVAPQYKGIIRSLRFMVNAANWLWTRIEIDGERLDLAASRFSDYRRRVDFKTGLYTRSFVWHLASGRSVRLTFERLVSMTDSHLGAQRVTFEPIDFAGDVRIRAGIDFGVIHEDQGKGFWRVIRRGRVGEAFAALGKTVRTGNRLFSGFRLDASQPFTAAEFAEENVYGAEFTLQLEPGSKTQFEKIAVNLAEKQTPAADDDLWQAGANLVEKAAETAFDREAGKQAAYWARVWETSDIVIDGDPDNQQGIRYCIFQLHQTYRGENPGFNIGAKGLTGEAYRGLAFWDTESYCLPFYLFNNPKAARSLLEFRYNTLDKAMARAKEVDCEGALYPIATIDGTESCDLWQHSNLQLHVGSAVAYAIRHYVNVTGDREFLYDKGAEMLVQISRFYASRGQWSPRTGQFGFYGVMGPDEFHMMVNHNAYTNFMAKKLFEYTLEVAAEMKERVPARYEALVQRTGLREEELAGWKRMADCMRIPKDEATGIYEQHDGYFDLPHLDVRAIPPEEFPLYHHWSYDRIYRYDMIKQPDVLMFLFLYNQSFTLEEKRVNYDYYEPRCIHESSLSPSIHSILAAEIGRHEDAYKFFEFATRLDLDNYNRNTREGLHMTSIAAAWMNIVYGFGGMRSDGEGLSFRPTIPGVWNGYSFHVTVHGSVLKFDVNRREVFIRVTDGDPAEITVYGRKMRIGRDGVRLPLEQGGNR
jgi:maltose phosphorylase